MTAPQFPGLGGSAGFPGLAGPASDPFAGSARNGSGPSPSSSRAEPAGPPLGLLAAAVAAPLVTVPLLFLDGWYWNVLGWAVATFGAAGLLIVATLQDTHRRASAWYLGNEALVQLLRLAAVLLALGMAAAHSWSFADWFSRLEVFAP